MYTMTRDARNTFIKVFGYEPSEMSLKKILSECYCVQFFKAINKTNNRPEILFHQQSEACFACDKHNKKIFAVYKAEKGFQEEN